MLLVKGGVEATRVLRGLACWCCGGSYDGGVVGVTYGGVVGILVVVVWQFVLVVW